jgi:hypothetical protein
MILPKFHRRDASVDGVIGKAEFWRLTRQLRWRRREFSQSLICFSRRKFLHNIHYYDVYDAIYASYYTTRQKAIRERGILLNPSFPIRICHIGIEVAKPDQQWYRRKPNYEKQSSLLHIFGIIDKTQRTGQLNGIRLLGAVYSNFRLDKGSLFYTLWLTISDFVHHKESIG